MPTADKITASKNFFQDRVRSAIGSDNPRRSGATRTMNISMILMTDPILPLNSLYKTMRNRIDRIAFFGYFTHLSISDKAWGEVLVSVAFRQVRIGVDTAVA